MTTKEPVLTTYTAKLLTWLYGEDFPHDLAMELDKFERIGEGAQRASNALGAGRLAWQDRERLRVAFGRWLQSADSGERARTIIAADAIARALDRERIAGAFQVSPGSPFPLQTIDQAAHGMLRWLRATGWDVVPAEHFDPSGTPETPFARGIVWDSQYGCVLRNPLVLRFHPFEEPDTSDLEAILPRP